jgi:hypothetical protein
MACMTAAIAACGGSQPATNSTQQPTSAAATSKASNRSDDEWKPSIRTAAIPADPCRWIPAAEVEEVVGKLAEPPRKEDGCRYTLVMPESIVARRQQRQATQAQLRENLRKAFGKAAEEEPESRNPFLEAQQNPRSYAVTVQVDVNGGVEAELAGRMLAKEFGVEMDTIKTEQPKAPLDWDDARSVPYGFSGRVGHLRVTVTGASPDVPREPMQMLAARVRDRIPDLPFPITNPYQIIQSGAGDPCSLLTRAEAEAVLGPLAVDPYRSSSNWPPLAHGQGHACAYFTAGHHVLVLSPEWEGGAQSFKINTGIGGLIGSAVPQAQESVVIKGPWEQARAGIAGSLMLLKGDRLLEVYYRTSRATRGDAIKLAAMAMPRLAP